MANERLRDSGGWGDYRLPQIWDMVKDEDPVPTYQQVDAWQRMAALCTDQADVLQKALDQLMVRWPPNPGSAAEVFKGHVDTMIWSMRDSAAAASANVAPLIKIVTALSQAKDEIGALVQQHAAFQGVAEDGAGPNALEPWENTLDAQARRIMALTDHKIGGAAADIRAPTLYRGIGPDQENEGTKPNLGGGSRSRPQVSPPVFDPPAPANTQAQAFGTEVGSDIGPIELDGHRLPLPTLDGATVPVDGTPSPFVTTPGGVALAPGGVIGAPSVTRNGAVEAGGAWTTGHSGTPGMLAPPMVGRGSSTKQDGRAVTSGGRRRRRNDPPDSWSPPPGGPEVLEPAPEPDYFDPGPNVIGIDR